MKPCGEVGEEALDEVRAALGDAACRLARARNPVRGPPSMWRRVAAARGTIVDTFEHEGRCYLVAAHDGPVLDPSQTLSPRERTVLAAAAEGDHDKLIAYDLGLASSTVRVIMFRAIRKLGATSRADAIARFRAAG